MPDSSAQRRPDPMNQLRGKKNNAQGFIFEDGIKKACRKYSLSGCAEIDKTPEPFRVMQKHGRGLFTGRFTAPAQPDFQGTLYGGQSIVFEAKYTRSDRIGRNVLTQNQMTMLEYHQKLGAISLVVFGIRDQFFALPWVYWRDMKQQFGRQYLIAADVQHWRVPFDGSVLFLDTDKRNMKGRDENAGSVHSRPDYRNSGL